MPAAEFIALCRRFVDDPDPVSGMALPTSNLPSGLPDRPARSFAVGLGHHVQLGQRVALPAAVWMTDGTRRGLGRCWGVF